MVLPMHEKSGMANATPAASAALDATLYTAMYNNIIANTPFL